MVQRSNKIRDSPQWRYKDDDIPGVLRDPPDEEKDDRCAGPTLQTIVIRNANYPMAMTRAALMWFTGT